MHRLEANIVQVKARLQAAAAASGRNPNTVMLLAVSKTRDPKSIQQVAQTGITNFGENYLQEALEKIDTLKSLGLIWHFIGPIQSNKTRQIAENFSWVHSIDRLKIAQRLSAQRPLTMPPLNICLQVNIDQEATKAGFSGDQIPLVIDEIAQLPNIKLRGLMSIPAAQHDPAAQRLPFAQLRSLLEETNCSLDNYKKLDTLSMGMSADLEAAILEQATIVRVGTDIFGPRNKTTL
ncbi:MAG: YggS family pyridoxal phosphate-dependent enzyme [Porticoccaceae bacterium]|nr:YggS family pyridoxal phosphate-dependent enzyme [Porticoccaceae bacterium]MDG1474297.1 YggS family pyridoxal phosphate-dependent enzyme [Porticoccaceae bacterium]